MKYIASFSGGKDSAATVILAHLHNEPLDEIMFSEVMFDKNISGELPEHIDFIKNVCKPTFESWGYKFTIVKSEKTYLDCFYHVVKKSSHPERIGMMHGFPLAGKCLINRDLKTPPIRNYLKQYGKHIQYVGIAKDEPIRLKRLKDNQVSLLDKYNLTEQDAFDLAKEYNLLSPTYSFAKRGGCWFCPNATLSELTNLYNNHYDLFAKLRDMEYNKDTINQIWNTLTSQSLHNIDRIIKTQKAQLQLPFSDIN